MPSDLIETVSETGSTNADVLARLRAGERLPEGFWLIADRQTGGRGRQGREWFDGAGNFMGSTVVHAAPGDPPMPSLAFVASLAAREAAIATGAKAESLMLKWPNDLLLDGAKLAGILLEGTTGAVVIGIGVNLVSSPAIEGVATANLSGAGREMFTRTLASHFATELQRWRNYGLGPLISRWQAAAHLPGTELSVHEPDGNRVSGMFDGLAEDGALRLRLADGSSRTIHAGDVAL